MEATAKNTDAFLAAIKALAAEKCKEIDRETESLRAQRLETLQNESEAHYAAFTAYEVSRVQAQLNHEVAALEADAKQRLAAQREEIFESVFQEAAERVRQFTETDAYRDFLLASAKSIAEMFQSDRVHLYLREADGVYADALCAVFSTKPKVVFKSDIELGGLRARGVHAGKLADDTLDARLEQQKQRFLEESGLSMER